MHLLASERERMSASALLHSSTQLWLGYIPHFLAVWQSLRNVNTDVYCIILLDNIWKWDLLEYNVCHTVRTKENVV